MIQIGEEKMKNVVGLTLMMGIMALTVAGTSQASLYAKKNSAKVLPDGQYGYLAQVYATSTVYKKANAHEAWFKAQLVRSYSDGTRQTQTSKKTFFGGQKVKYANSPTAAWPFAQCSAKMQ